MTPGETPSDDLLKRGAIFITGAGGVRSLKDLQSLRGISKADFETMAEDAGMTGEPMPPQNATGGEGVRFEFPGDRSLMLMWEKGDPGRFPEGNVHRGPYIKAQASKKLMGEKRGWEGRVPAEGNPHPDAELDAEFPSQVQGWLDENLAEARMMPEETVEFPEGVGP